jgi:modification target Cys-rich repeat protein
MKKVVLSLIAGVALLVASCGPTAKQVEANRVADSTYVADSLVRCADTCTQTCDSTMVK